MHNYLIGFSIYTLAMIGIIFLGFFVVKKFSISRRGARSHNNFLEIETSLSLEPRKTLHVIRAGEDRILIATDAENTSFLTKLGTIDENPEKRFKESVNEVKYCSGTASTNYQGFQAFTPPEKVEQPKVFKDLMKRLQEE